MFSLALLIAIHQTPAGDGSKTVYPEIPLLCRSRYREKEGHTVDSHSLELGNTEEGETRSDHKGPKGLDELFWGKEIWQGGGRRMRKS